MATELTELMASEMEKAVEGLAHELATIRTGRASPSLVDSLQIDYHGAPLPLRQIATVSAPEANLLVIQPWDPSSLSTIEKAILKSNLGFNPSNDGNVIRIAVPPLTEERRTDLAKLVAGRVEDRRVSLRNIRRDTINKLRQMEKNKEISEDELSGTVKQVEETTKSFVDRATQLGQDKEREIKEL
jgi:ribosome recycling factor